MQDLAITLLGITHADPNFTVRNRTQPSQFLSLQCQHITLRYFTCTLLYVALPLPRISTRNPDCTGQHHAKPLLDGTDKTLLHHYGAVRDFADASQNGASPCQYKPLLLFA